MRRLHGTWEATGSSGAGCGPVVVAVVLAVLVAGSGAAAAVEAAATLILAIVVAVAAVSVAGLVAGMVLLRRYSQRGAEQLAMQAAALRAEVEGRTVSTVSAPAVHYHVHLAAGMDAGAVLAALPRDRARITEKE